MAKSITSKKTAPSKPVYADQRGKPDEQITSHHQHMAEVADTLSGTALDPHFTTRIEPLPSPTDRINERELTSIYALLAYVAYNQNVRQETLQMIVEAEFGVDNVAKIQRKDYMRAIEFLVDLKLDEVLN